MNSVHDFLVPAYVILLAIVAVGFINQLLTGIIYLRRIHSAGRVEGKRRAWLERMYQTYQRDVLKANVSIGDFVKKELSITNSLGFSVYKFGRFIGVLSFLTLIYTIAAVGYISYRFIDFKMVYEMDEDFVSLIIFAAVGLGACIVLLILKKLSYLKEKEECLTLVLINYFENIRAGETKKLKPEIKPQTLVSAKGAQAPVVTGQTPDVMQAAVACQDMPKVVKLDKGSAEMAAEFEGFEDESYDNSRMLKTLEEYDEITPEENEESLEEENEPKQVEEVLEKANVQPRADQRTRRATKSLDTLGKTLSQAYPQKKISGEEEKLIEEVLKEYLFR